MSQEERRIYVAIPATVQIEGRTIVQVPGRQAVQGGHAKSMVHYQLFLRDLQIYTKPQYEAITTIYKGCRDSYELNHVAFLIGKIQPAPIAQIFCDINRDVYGVGGGIPTAVAAYLTSEEAYGVLDYLPLWDGK
jgi:hypothetical protein